MEYKIDEKGLQLILDTDKNLSDVEVKGASVERLLTARLLIKQLVESLVEIKKEDKKED